MLRCVGERADGDALTLPILQRIEKHNFLQNLFLSKLSEHFIFRILNKRSQKTLSGTYKPTQKNRQKRFSNKFYQNLHCEYYSS